MLIALWGGVDAVDGERQAERRVVEAALRRRLPGCELIALSERGLPLAVDGGRPTQPVPAGAAEVAALTATLDCVVTLDGGDGGLGAHLPVVPAGAATAPPLGLGLPGLLDPDTLDRRIRLLRLLGWASPPGRTLTVGGAATVVAGAVQDVVTAVLPLVEAGAVTVQLAAASAAEDELAAALEAGLGGACRRVPGVAAVEDLVALVAGSAAYLGSPGLGLWAALALGVPTVMPAAAGLGEQQDLLAELAVARPRSGELGATLGALLGGSAPRRPAGAVLDRLERHLDTLAERVVEAAGRRPRWEASSAEAAGGLPADARIAALEVAHEARGLRLFAERRAAEAAHEATAAALGAALEEATAEADRLRSELAAAREANDRMVASRTWRYTQPVRDTLARIRERRA